MLCRKSKRVAISLIFAFFLSSIIEAETPLRSFEDLFPGFTESQKNEIFSPEGIIRSIRSNEPLLFIPAVGSGVDLYGAVTRSNPSFLAESLLVIPYPGRALGKLDIYNALGKIGDLKGRLYHSHTRGAEVPLFEEATRVDGGRRNTPISDPPPAATFPASETVFIRLKDVNFGNTFYRGDMSISPHGITYSLTNTRNISYLFFTVMREGRFTAVLYMEPLREGVLVYSMAGAEASDFVSNRVDIPSAISKRLEVFIGWVGDGLRVENR